MKRGEVWTVSGADDYAGKPRPVVIIQDDSFDATESITICPLTTAALDVPLARPALAPSEENGLRHTSRFMVDKLTTVPRTKLGRLIGRLSDGDLARLNQVMLVFLGLATQSRG